MGHSPLSRNCPSKTSLLTIKPRQDANHFICIWSFKRIDDQYDSSDIPLTFHAINKNGIGIFHAILPQLLMALFTLSSDDWNSENAYNLNKKVLTETRQVIFRKQLDSWVNVDSPLAKYYRKIFWVI